MQRLKLINKSMKNESLPITSEAKIEIPDVYFDTADIELEKDYTVNWAPASSELLKGSEIIKLLQSKKVIWMPFRELSIDPGWAPDFISVNMLDDEEKGKLVG